ncbi:MAG: hypothetical protein JO200_18100 [Comamonas sp.]|nr:hypothetical protein [Comamonas sp.]
MRLLRLATAFMTVISIAGCGSIGTQFTTLAEPDSGDRARVRVVQAASAFVRAVPGKSCLDWSTPGAGTVIGGMVGASGYKGRKLDMPGTDLSKQFTSAEMYVAANKPITFAMLTGPESSLSCSVAAAFVPEKDKDYEVFFGMDRRVCVARVVSLSDPTTKVDFSRPEGSCKQ